MAATPITSINYLLNQRNVVQNLQYGNKTIGPSIVNANWKTLNYPNGIVGVDYSLDVSATGNANGNPVVLMAFRGLKQPANQIGSLTIQASPSTPFNCPTGQLLGGITAGNSVTNDAITTPSFTCVAPTTADDNADTTPLIDSSVPDAPDFLNKKNTAAAVVATPPWYQQTNVLLGIALAAIIIYLIFF